MLSVKTSRICRLLRLPLLVVPAHGPAVGGLHWVLMNPSGDVAIQQRNLILVSTGAAADHRAGDCADAAVFAWRYRKANTRLTTARTGTTPRSWS
jgi:cytochrome o ubiquinol oxidase subunit 2